MTNKEAIGVIKFEIACVNRQNTPRCKRDCANCDLCLPTEDVLEAFTRAIKALEQPEVKGDLISRSALRKAFKNHPLCNDVWLQYSREIIDNARTVAEDYDTGYQDGLEDGLNDIRSQGEWLKSSKGKTIFFCSECGREIDTKPFTRPDNFPFCHCGADMRGKE